MYCISHATQVRVSVLFFFFFLGQIVEEADEKTKIFFLCWILDLNQPNSVTEAGLRVQTLIVCGHSVPKGCFVCYLFSRPVLTLHNNGTPPFPECLRNHKEGVLWFFSHLQFVFLDSDVKRMSSCLFWKAVLFAAGGVAPLPAELQISFTSGVGWLLSSSWLFTCVHSHCGAARRALWTNRMKIVNENISEGSCFDRFVV